jgi:hypothetical protein
MIELNRTETVLSALTQGITGTWAEDHVMAHGLSGQRNPLGNALNHLLANPSRGNMYLAVFLLSGELQKERIGHVMDSVDIARDAITYWLSWLCPACSGRGVINIEQDQCQECGGTGRRERPKDPVKSAVSVIERHIEWMEGQLKARLKNYGDLVGVERIPHLIKCECTKHLST